MSTDTKPQGHDTTRRVVTALLVLGVAVAASCAALWWSRGVLVSLSFTWIIVGISAFEAVRLLSRDSVSLQYRIFFGSCLYLGFMTGPLGVLVESYANVSRALGEGGMSSPYGYFGFLLSGAVLLSMVVFDRDLMSKQLLLPFILVSVLGSALIPLAAVPGAVGVLWWLFGTIAVSDSAAYFVGRKLGRIKLAPTISPNKTVEGALGGVVGGVVTGALFGKFLLSPNLSVVSLAIVALLVVVVAQVADLAKSAFKRSCGVKDTGAFFPGHGGFLDRFDGVLGGGAVLLCCWRFL